MMLTSFILRGPFVAPWVGRWPINLAGPASITGPVRDRSVVDYVEVGRITTRVFGVFLCQYHSTKRPNLNTELCFELRSSGSLRG